MVGSLGVIGPTRMEFQRVVSLVDVTAKLVSLSIAQQENFIENSTIKMTILGTRKFLANLNYEHGRPEKIGVLLVNLGTPEAPTPTAVRPYLKEFLSDPVLLRYQADLVAYFKFHHFKYKAKKICRKVRECLD